MTSPLRRSQVGCTVENETKAKDEERLRICIRICVACRRETSRNELIRLTFDYKSKKLHLNTGTPQDRFVCGRSAYLCRNISCVDQALKGNRLRIALEGRRPKNQESRRKVGWPLESQLVHVLRQSCTEAVETCQNTPRVEGT